MTQPQQTRLKNLNIYETGSFQTANNTTTDQLRRWAVLIGTGAMTSVASQEHFTHIPTKPLRSTITCSSKRRRHPHIRHQRGDSSLVHDNLAIPTRFIICDVNCALLGLDTITKNKQHLKVEGYRGQLARDHAEAQLDYIGNHFHLKATIFDGLYDYVDYTPEFRD
eukprot:2965357-Amphidinium_carterae.1